MSGDPSGSPRAVDWTPSKAQWAWINLVGVALTVLGFVGHFAAWALSRSASGGRFGLTDVVMLSRSPSSLLLPTSLVTGWHCSPLGIDRLLEWRVSAGLSWV